MSKAIVNVTMPIILEEIDNVLESEPYCSQRYLISLNHLRQDLITYTLSRVRSRIRLIESGEQLSIPFSASPSALEEHLKVETVVRQGIQYLLYEAEKMSQIGFQPSSTCA